MYSSWCWRRERHCRYWTGTNYTQWAVCPSNSGEQRPTCWPVVGTPNFTFLQQFGADAADGWRVLHRSASCSAARAVRLP